MLSFIAFLLLIWQELQQDLHQVSERRVMNALISVLENSRLSFYGCAIRVCRSLGCHETSRLTETTHTLAVCLARPYSLSAASLEN